MAKDSESNNQITDYLKILLYLADANTKTYASILLYSNLIINIYSSCSENDKQYLLSILDSIDKKTLLEYNEEYSRLKVLSVKFPDDQIKNRLKLI